MFHLRNQFMITSKFTLHKAFRYFLRTLILPQSLNMIALKFYTYIICNKYTCQVGMFKIYCTDKKRCLKKFGHLCIGHLPALAEIIRDLGDKKGNAIFQGARDTAQNQIIHVMVMCRYNTERNKPILYVLLMFIEIHYEK